jgi:hypothetical protein
LIRKLKHKVVRESVPVPLHGSIECLSLHFVERLAIRE